MLLRANRIIIPITLLIVASVAHAASEHPMRFIDDTAEGEYNVLCPIVIESEGELRLGFDATDTGDISWLSIANGAAAFHRLSGGAAQRIGDTASVGLTGVSQLTLQRRDDRVRAIVGDQLVLDVPWDAPLGGSIGVSSSGRYVASKPAIQPVDPPMVTDDFTREAANMGDWETSGGSFANTMVEAAGAEAALSSNPFSMHVQAEDEAAVATTGYWFWDSYRVSLNVRPVEAPEVELRAWVQDDANYLALRWQAGDAQLPGARRLVLVHDGVEHVLDEAPGGYLPGEWYRLELQVTPGHVAGLIDRERVLEARTPAFAQGAVGLAVAAGDAFFDDLFVAPANYRGDWPVRINPVFLADEIMTREEVFVPSGFWRGGDAAGEYWHWGEFFHDARVTIPAELLAEGLGVLLKSDGDAAAGYRVDLTGAEGQLAIALARNGTEVATESVAIDAGEALVVEFADGAVEVAQGDRTLWRHVDPQPLAGRLVALLGAPERAVNEVTVLSEHFRDYVFDRSPTDWFAGRGTWGVNTRWPCQPGWTFYGGAGDESPQVWSKHIYHGDFVLEWFGAIQSDNINRIRYVRPSDINTTICGDGRTPGSGYSFLFGGWNNTKTAILRNGEVVAETDEALLGDVNARDLADHRGWTRIRIEKFGNQIRMYHAKELVLEYTDPDPLPDGRLGMWSFHNEPVVGRLRLWYTQEGAPSVVRKPEPRLTELEPTPRPAEAAAIFDDFEAGVGEWQPVNDAAVLLELDAQNAASGRASLRVTNQEDGGPFAVAAVTTPFSLEDWPQLSFDYRLSPGAEVSLYLLISRRWYAVTLTGAQAPWDNVPVIGVVSDARADGQWRHTTVDLLAGLREANPALSNAVVSQVVISPPWESYALCGVGGNVYGTSYWIDNFRIGPAG